MSQDPTSSDEETEDFTSSDEASHSGASEWTDGSDPPLSPHPQHAHDDEWTSADIARVEQELLDARRNALTPATMAEDANVANVSMKLPGFWAKNPAFWFVQAESQFALARVNTEITKFHHVVRAIDNDTAEQVLSKISTPRAGHEYEDLKAALTNAFARPRRERAACLADMGGLGDRKPTQLLNEMKALLGQDSTTHLLFEHHFLANLPSEVRTGLAQMTYDTIEDMAAAADKMCRERSIAALSLEPSIAAVAKPKKKGKKATDRQQEPNSDGACYYHATYGAKAKKCRAPCTFSGNDAASQE
jgi:hypothetical protein